MLTRVGRAARRVLRALTCSAAGATVVLLVVFVYYLNSQADLSLWHTVKLDEEFTADSGVQTFY